MPLDVAIYMVGTKGHFTARAFNEETQEHIWSSEDAPSIKVALSEVGEAIEKYAAPSTTGTSTTAVRPGRRR